jgi:hypothetical protein
MISTTISVGLGSCRCSGIRANTSTGEVRIRMHFNRFVGATVFHCHIVAHEDNGMMGLIDITKDGLPSKATRQTLDKMNRDMPSHHAMHGAGH